MIVNKSKPIDILASIFSLYLIFFALGFYLTILMLLRNVFNFSLPQYLILTEMQHMSMFLAGMLLIAFLIHPIGREKRKWYDWLLAIIASTGGFYMFFIYPELTLRMGIVTIFDIIFGLIAILFLIEAGRRTVGLPLAILVIIFILYGFWDANFDIGSLVTRIYLYNVGIFSTPLEVATFMIFIFIFFGTLLSELGAGEYLTNLALALTGSRKGGPAKVAVVASSLVGTMSGSATGNVVTTGTFTIPLMKKIGYKPETAAAIEAAASTGGQIMPPVLGSAAFIMPLFLGVRYWDIVIASVIPAILYYLALYIYVDQEASKQKLYGLPREKLPPLKPLLLRLYFLIPVAILVYILSAGFSAEYAAVTSIMSALLIEWFIRGKTNKLLATIFLILLIIIGSILSWSGLNIPSTLIMLGGLAIFITIIMGMILKGAREMSIIVIKSLSNSFKQIIPVAVACALAGIISGVLTYTGLAQRLSSILIEISGGNLIILLLLIMGITIILGMGMPTPAVYVLGAVMFAPALISFGIPAIAAHFFIFYFGIFAPLTPPVAITSYAGASIANADFWKTGYEAFRAALVSWVIAFTFISKPEMLILPISQVNVHVIYNLVVGVIACVISIISLTGAISGYFLGYLNKLQRGLLIISILFILLGLFYYEYFLIIAILLTMISITKGKVRIK